MSGFKKAKLCSRAKSFAMYAMRWQLSTPIYAGVLYLVTDKMGYTAKTVLANFIGACIFYWVDRFIFLKGRHSNG